MAGTPRFVLGTRGDRSHRHRCLTRRVNAGAGKSTDHQGPQSPAGLELLTGQRARHQAQGNDVDLDAFHAHQGGRIQQQLAQQLVVARMLARLAQRVVDHAQVSAGLNRDVDDGARPIFRQVYRFDDLTVGDR